MIEKRGARNPHGVVITVRLLTLAVVAACQANTSGHVSAGKVGDTSRPATRGSPVADLRAACGEGALTPAGTAAIRRHPYLQQVTSTSAMVGWVTTATGSAHVEVTAVDGARMPVGLAEAAVAAVRGPDEHQMWAHLEGLQPDTIYCYALHSDGEQLTQPTGFRTPPAAESTRPLRFMVFGDSGGGGTDQYELLDQMYTVPYDVIIHTGDLAYDNGTIGQFEDNVFGVYYDLLRNVPMFPAAGNHDVETLQGAPFRDVFALPSAGNQKWYAFDWGRIHFVALDTEADYRTQAAWLDRDLAATELPWKIVYLHKPPYSSGTHGSDMALRAALAPIVERHHVQLLLAGHDHDYERMVPQNGVAYIVTGGGGVGTRSVGSSSFTAFSDDVIHFVYGEVGLDELELHAIDAAGLEFDSALVSR
jgi:acid phosphatase type 7